MQVVLQRSSREKQTALGIEHADSSREEGLIVLDSMGFIDNEVSPVELHEVSALSIDNFVGGDHCIKFSVDNLSGVQMSAFFPISVKTDNSHYGAPLDKFFHPIVNGAFGNNYQERTVKFSELFQVGHHSDALNSLSKTHFVG